MRRRAQASLEIIVGVGLLGLLLVAVISGAQVAWLAGLERAAQAGADRAGADGRDPVAGARQAVPPGFRARIAIDERGRVRGLRRESGP